MAISNRERIGRALDILRDGLLPYVESQLNENEGFDWKIELPPYSNNLQDVNVLLNFS